jgi:hypothetical protein
LFRSGTTPLEIVGCGVRFGGEDLDGQRDGLMIGKRTVCYDIVLLCPVIDGDEELDEG